MKESIFKKFAVWGTAVVLIVFGGYLLVRLAPSLFEGLFERRQETRTQAPPFSLPALGGATVNSADFLGRNTVVLFWTTWNETSLDQLEILKSLPPELLRRKDIALFAVNSLEEEPQVTSAAENLDKEKITFLLDEDGAASEAYNAGVLPLTVFIDRNGFIVEEIAGPISRKELERVIKTLR